MDIEVPRKLHRKVGFNLYPALPERRVVTFRNLSPTSKKLLIKKLGKSAALRYKSVKLMSTLFKKKRYKIHYLLLKQALQLGYKLTKVHRAMSFTQERFSQDFLNFMTGRRKNAKSKLEERQCKVVF